MSFQIMILTDCRRDPQLFRDGQFRVALPMIVDPRYPLRPDVWTTEAMEDMWWFHVLQTVRWEDIDRCWANASAVFRHNTIKWTHFQRSITPNNHERTIKKAWNAHKQVSTKHQKPPNDKKTINKTPHTNNHQKPQKTHQKKTSTDKNSIKIPSQTTTKSKKHPKKHQKHKKHHKPPTNLPKKSPKNLTLRRSLQPRKKRRRVLAREASALLLRTDSWWFSGS